MTDQAPEVGRDGGQLWAGRFSKPPAPEAHALGRSLHFDVRLARYDVRASIAHVGALRRVGLLNADDAAALESTLRQIGDEIAAGTFVFDDRDEDVHSAIERELTHRAGEAGARLHAGRSRNDLVVTDVRLWLLDAGDHITDATTALVRTLIARAREHAGTVMPGTTHGRAAQPVTLGHHLLAHGWALTRDVERLAQWSRRTSVSPLGAGALGTSTLDLDPVGTAEALGFAGAFENSLDAVSDRDFVQEFVSVATIGATHLSRLAADVARWTDPALGWAELDEAYATGSSMMPHKRNPDTAELARGKAARIAGDLVALTALLQGLPLGYHRDLQEDKEPAFDAADTLLLVLPALEGCISMLTFDVDVMRAACADEGLYATDLAEALVRSGVPFREAHRRTGALLKRVAAEGRSLRDLNPGEWEAFGVSGGAALLNPDAAVVARGGRGGPSTESVLRQADALDGVIADR